MPFSVQHGRQRIRKLGNHVVPRQMDACMILQVPVQPYGNADWVVSADDYLFSLLVQFKEIFARGGFLFYDELARRARHHSFQQTLNGRHARNGREQAK